MHSIDVFVQNYFSLIRTPLNTELIYLVTIMFDFSFHFVLLVGAFALLILLFRNYHYSFLFLFSIILGGISVYFLKIFFNVNRPVDGVMMVFGKSFPSGHATVATIFFIMLGYILSDLMERRLAIIFRIMCGLFIFLVAFSRVYLGVHWVSDVAFGILLGVAVSFFSIWLFKFFPYQQRTL